MIVQLVVFAIAVVGVTLKTYWHKLLGFFGHRANEKKDADE